MVTLGGANRRPGDQLARRSTLVFTPAINQVLGHVPPELAGAGSGVLTTVIQLASLVGIAAGGTLFFVRRAHGSGSLPVRSATSFTLTASVIAVLQIAALAAAMRLRSASHTPPEPAPATVETHAAV